MSDAHIASVSADRVPPPASEALPLNRLPRNARATVLELRGLGQPDDQDRILRLTEIGFVPGEPVRVIAHGFPGGEPIAVRIGRSTFALRAHEAALVLVTADGKAGA